MNRIVMSFFLKAGVLLVVRIFIGRLFQAAGPATPKARSPNFNDVRETSKVLLSADCRPGCVVVTDCSSSATELGDWPLSARWTRRHSLKFILARISIQCNSMVSSVTWSLGRRPYTNLVAALMTRCNG